ncbi:hypothetical protein M2212_007117 [Bradyrhizobium elkanii]|jgi:hypothetical protein|uniref:hypothetical protein n=1 Tax=Bradyrhizobium elkanii TaxID=29448 RepID=UPI002167D1F1|nr:hypothetical protein [Bradyrhizobium elkanii]MCS3480271.1 hypothetical protein [Bradyrhizobium elkanii]
MAAFFPKSPASRLGTAQNVALSTTSTTSAASTNFGTETYQVLLVATADCNVRIGNTPTAVTTDTYLPAKVPMVFICTPGQQVAGVTASTATLSVTELS